MRAMKEVEETLSWGKTQSSEGTLLKSARRLAREPRSLNWASKAWEASSGAARSSRGAS